MNEFFSLPVLVGIAHSGIRLATPYIYAAIGEMFAQRSGVLNLGVDGMMLMGAFAAFYATFYTQNLWLGILLALLVGTVMGLLMAFVSVTMKAEQGISGIGIYLVGLGLSDLLFRMLVGSVVGIASFPTLHLPWLSDLPVIGEIFFDHSILIYLAYLLVPVSWFVLNKTTFGLKVRAVGHNPEAADSLGVQVNRVRYATVMLGGALAGLAGAALSVGLLNVFQQNITNGMGFIAVALVYFGSWRPFGILAGALLFSTVNALQLWVQVKGIAIPSDLAVMLPYILTIVALALAVRQVQQPAALTKPFTRGE